MNMTMETAGSTRLFYWGAHPGIGIAKETGFPKDMKVVCLGGQRHPCAGDCGSTPGWDNLKAVFKNPRKKDPDGGGNGIRQHALIRIRKASSLGNGTFSMSMMASKS